MGIYDLSLKAVFDDNPEDLIRLALGEEVALEEVRLEPTETLVLERKQDRLAWVRAGGQEFLFLPEFKVSYQADIDEQIFTYVSRASIVHGFLPVWPVVYYLTNEDYPRHPKTSYTRSVLGRQVSEVQFSEVRLFEWNASEVLEQRQGALLALLPFMKGAEPQKLVEASQAIDSLERPPETRRNLPIVLALLSAKVFPELDLDAIIPRRVYMESALYQSIVEEGLLKGLEKARIAQVELLLKILEQKLGHPPLERHRKMLAKASIEAIHRLNFELSLAPSPAHAHEAVEKLTTENSKS